MVAPLRWVTNTLNPKKSSQMTIICRNGETPGQALNRYLRWVDQFYIGEPKATEVMSVEELKAQDIVGLYQSED